MREKVAQKSKFGSNKILKKIKVCPEGHSVVCHKENHDSEPFMLSMLFYAFHILYKTTYCIRTSKDMFWVSVLGSHISLLSQSNSHTIFYLKPEKYNVEQNKSDMYIQILSCIVYIYNSPKSWTLIGGAFWRWL